MSSLSKISGAYDVSTLVDVPLLVFHPNFQEQHRYLPALVNAPGRTPLFVAVEQPGTTPSQFWTLFANALDAQCNVKLPAFDEQMAPEKWSQAVLKKIGKTPFCLIIDAYDQVNEAALAPTLAALVAQLPPASQIVLNGRQLPITLLADARLAGKTALFPINDDQMLIDYSVRSSEQILLEVYSLGAGRALINGARIDHWDGMLPRALFFYLIDKGMTTRDEIFQTFWPNLPVREATNVFHVTKRKISEILGFDLTTYWSGFYRISPNVDLHYDVVKFVEAVQNSAIADDADAIPMLRSAIHLYRGAFLTTLESEWVTERQTELRGIYGDALTTLAKLYEQQGSNEPALGLYLRAAATQPQREDLARSIMSLYKTLGQSDRALQVYERLTYKLKQTLNVNPDKRTIELAQELHAKA